MSASIMESQQAELVLATQSPLLFETIVCDLHWSAIKVGALTMVLSACAQPGATGTLHPFRHLLHGDAKAILLALRYGANVGFDSQAVARLSHFFGGVATAAAPLIALADAAIFDRGQRAHLPALREIWRRLSAEASAAIAAAEPAVRSRLDASYIQDGKTLSQFLARAAAGESADLDDGGTIRLPKLAQRRRAPRTAVSGECELILPSGKFAARLIDASREGLGVECNASLSDGQSVVVALADGRRLEAVVARRNGATAGLSLRRALSSSDPLLRSGAASLRTA